MSKRRKKMRGKWSARKRERSLGEGRKMRSEEKNKEEEWKE